MAKKKIMNEVRERVRFHWDRKPGMNELADDEKNSKEEGFGIFPRCDRAANMLIYDPSDKQIVPKEGGWVFITRKLPVMEGGIDQHVRVATVFYAHHLADADDVGFRPDGRYMVQLHTPWGDVTVMPYEYAVMDPVDMVRIWQTGEMLFHPTNMEPARFNDIAFYCRSRGIDLVDAMVMALGTMQGDVGWFEPHPDLVPALEEMEEHVHRWKPERTIDKPMEVHLEIKGEMPKEVIA